MKRLSNIFSLAVVFIFMFFSAVFTQDVEQKKTLGIGMVADGPWERNDEIAKIFENEILELLRGEADIKFYDYNNFLGDWTLDGVSSAIDKILSDEEIDIVLAMGVASSFLVSQHRELPKPVIAPFVLDAEIQDIPYSNGVSGVKNLNYINSPTKTLSDIKRAHEIYTFKKLTVLLNRLLQEAYPGIRDYFQQAAEEEGFEFNAVFIEGAAEAVLNAIPSDADAVFLMYSGGIPLKELTRLIEGINKRRLPSFTGFIREYVESGVFVGIIPDNFFIRHARRTALNIQRILSDERPETIPVDITENSRLIINMKTAREIDVFPSWDIINEAELINEIREEIERRLTLSSAVREAVQVNLDLEAKEHYVAAGRQNINEARSYLLPGIKLSGLQTVIDEDRAEKSFGQQSERMFTGSAKATQIIFSEKAWTNYSIQKSLQTSREEEFNQLKLDIIRDAATAYLNLLKMKTIENIQIEYLKLTRNNHEIAQIRRSIGVAGPSEVYRWESEIATSRKSVIEANTMRNSAEIALNRLLHHHLEEPFITEETSLNDPILLTSDERYFEYTRDKQSFRALRDFFVIVGLESSPELHALDAAISAQARALSSAKRAYWMPTIAVQGSADNIFNRAGTGSGGVDLEFPPEMSGIFSQPKDFSWNIGLNISFPLFEGGLRYSEHQRVREELRQFEIEREAIEERIEQGVRSYMHIAGGSYAGIKLSQTAAGAARKNLELVQDAYSKGIVSIIDLIDAQKAALGADLAATNAVYTFMIDLLNVQRAMGKLYVTATREEQDALFDRMEEYIAKKREQQ